MTYEEKNVDTAKLEALSKDLRAVLLFHQKVNEDLSDVIFAWVCAAAFDSALSQSLHESFRHLSGRAAAWLAHKEQADFLEMMHNVMVQIEEEIEEESH